MTLEQRLSSNRTFLMGMAILSIMLFHQSWIYGWNPIFAFFHFYGNWGVDVFFFVSGFGLYHSLKKDDRIFPFYYRRIIRILPLCLACGLIRYMADHVLPVGTGGYPTGDHPITANWITILSWDRWFIPVIMLYYLLMPLIYKGINRYGKNLMWLIYLVAIMGVYEGNINTYTFRLPAFCMGVIVSAGLYKNSRCSFTIGCIAIVVAMAYKFMIVIDSPWIHNDNYTYIILSLGIVVLCYLLTRIIPLQFMERGVWGSSVLMKSLGFLGRHTLEIYLVHETVYRYAYRFMIDTPIPLLVQMTVGIIVSIIIAILINSFVKGILRFVKI